VLTKPRRFSVYVSVRIGIGGLLIVVGENEGGFRGEGGPGGGIGGWGWVGTWWWRGCRVRGYITALPFRGWFTFDYWVVFAGADAGEKLVLLAWFFER
jgi:hypothetical protein